MARTKREAVTRAIAEYNRLQRLRRLAAKLGTFQGFPDGAELQRRRKED